MLPAFIMFQFPNTESWAWHVLSMRRSNMSKLERAVRRTRRPIPSLKELEMSLSEEENDSKIREIFEGWHGKRKLPPETVLMRLVEEAKRP